MVQMYSPVLMIPSANPFRKNALNAIARLTLNGVMTVAADAKNKPGCQKQCRYNEDLLVDRTVTLSSFKEQS